MARAGRFKFRANVWPGALDGDFGAGQGEPAAPSERAVRLGRILDAARSRTPTQRDADKRLFLGTLDSSAARADFERHGWTSPINFDRISAFWEEMGVGD